MKKLILIPLVCMLFASLGWGRESATPKLHQVKHRAHHATRHHGHKATRHHAARHHHAA
jgi:hypothetical protein